MAEIKRILIVDDEGLNALALGEFLMEEGPYLVDYAATGATAVEKAEKNLPDIILLDIRLPGGMDGLEAAERILRIGSVPIIILSGYSDDILQKRGLAFEPAGFLSKPFGFEEVGRMIEAVL